MIPKEARIFPLKPNSKEPKTPQGHLNAVKVDRKGRPSSNYGIALSSSTECFFIVVDIDEDHPERNLLEDLCKGTWAQKTSRESGVGMHYLFSAPKGFQGHGKKVYSGSDKQKIADIKAKGYIVGPGSSINGHSYEMTNSVEPLEAPSWLLAFIESEPQASSISTEEFEGVPHGSHDEFLHKLASWLRGSYGLSEPVIKQVLHKGPLEALQGTDRSNPYSESDCLRIAHSAASYAPEMRAVEFQLVDGEWRTALDLPEEQPITRWLMYNFIPQHELALQYGTGGIGKSTWVSWLAGILLKKGLKVGFSASEEPFERFANRTHMGHPDMPRELLGNLYDIGNRWVFPKDAEKMQRLLEKCHLDFLYFDSIYSLFDPSLKMPNLAEKARPVLTPLIQIAQECKIGILGTFHENKTGDFNGPKDMENIPRVMIHATSKSQKLNLQVHKTNFNDPTYALNMIGELRPEITHAGNPVLEENEQGDIVQRDLYVVTGYQKVEKEYTFELLDDNKKERDFKIMNLVSLGMSDREIEKELGIPKSTIGDIRRRNN